MDVLKAAKARQEAAGGGANEAVFAVNSGKALFPRLGFEFEGVLKRFYGPLKGDDAFVYRLDRKAAERWK